jgi:hypothetical protein
MQFEIAKPSDAPSLLACGARSRPGIHPPVPTGEWRRRDDEWLPPNLRVTDDVNSPSTMINAIFLQFMAASIHLFNTFLRAL